MQKDEFANDYIAKGIKANAGIWRIPFKTLHWRPLIALKYWNSR